MKDVRDEETSSCPGGALSTESLRGELSLPDLLIHELGEEEEAQPTGGPPGGELGSGDAVEPKTKLSPSFPALTPPVFLQLMFSSVFLPTRCWSPVDRGPQRICSPSSTGSNS